MCDMMLFSPQTISTDGTLFSSLENHWQFRPGPALDSGPTCLVNFWVSIYIEECVLGVGSKRKKSEKGWHGNSNHGDIPLAGY